MLTQPLQDQRPVPLAGTQAGVDMDARMADIQAFRREIDRADDAILQALQMRAQAVKRLAGIKRELGLPAYDPRREQQVMARVSDRAHVFPAPRRRAIFAAILAEMREWQVRPD